MKSFAAASLAALALVLPAFGAPTAATITVKTLSGPVKPDSYIVVLKATANKAAHLDSLNKIAARADVDAYTEVTHDYSHVLNGYAAVLRGAALDHVLASKDVEFVEQDGIASLDYQPGTEEGTVAKRSIETRASGGSGVVIYGIDTGIYTAHSTFGGRASWGATYGGYASADGNGHGTHTAGTAVGATYGVATAATIVAVKVLSDAGSGAYSDVVSGVNYAYNAYRSSGKPSIATLSLGGPISSALDSAIATAINGGLHFTIAAGNSNVDAATTSPADVPGANTVGAIDSKNVKASFSNYGSIVDIQALGVNVLSAWIGSTTATNTISGTSMATPFVAGVLAVALGEYGSVSPASLSASLKSHAQAIVTGEPSGTTNLKATLW